MELGFPGAYWQRTMRAHDPIAARIPGRRTGGLYTSRDGNASRFAARRGARTAILDRRRQKLT